MVPAAFVTLDELPLTPNGKLDRAALPAPESRPELESAYVAPRNATEEILAGIWREILGLERVGIHDNFFELGGHSLLGAQLAARVRDALGVELPLRTLLESPTVGALAAVVAASERRPEAPPLEPVDRTGELELSFAQQRLWFLDQLEPGGAQYNVPFALRVSGVLKTDALRRALNAVVARHESLRTTFTSVDGRAVQVVGPPGPFDLELVALDDLAEPERLPEARRIASEAAQRPFDLRQGPLLRASLLRLGEDDHVLVLVMHHIVSDGWSLGVFERELGALYDAFSRDEPSPLDELAIQYADFAAWQRRWLSGDVLDDQIAYWREHLAGLPPVLELPTDRPRSAAVAARGSTHSFGLDAATVCGLRALSRARNATLFMTLASAFKVLLARYSGQTDIAVGTPIAGRTHAELEDLVGFFVNTLVLRTDLSGDPSFVEVLARVRDVALNAYAHQDVPFERLVEELQPQRSLSHTPLFQVAFTLETTSAAVRTWGDASVTRVPVDANSAKFDLQLVLRESGDGIEGELTYNAGLFDGSTIARLAGHLRNLLEAVAADPEAPLSELDMLGASERHRLVSELNDTETPFPATRCVHDLFESRVEQTPAAVALVAGEVELTYEELDARANRLAHHLRALGVSPGTTVGVCLDRGVEVVVGLLAILKAGGAYVPVDPDYPVERIGFMLADSGAAVLVTHRGLHARLPEVAGAVVLVDADRNVIDACPDAAPGRTSSADDLAYVIYTSGSTGTPKGVAVTHRSLVNLVSWHASSYGIEPGDRGAHIAPLGFDASVWELWPYLSSGASLVLPPEHVRTSPDELVEWLNDNGVSVTFVPTALVHELFSGGGHASLRARAILTGGDQLRVRPDGATRFELVNHYGPTEATVVASAGRVDAGGTPPSIGRPIANTTVYILDRHGNPVPIGVPGELYVGGVGVARGYVNRAALTAERFVPDPFSGAAGARLYRTGDRCRYLSDGNLEFLGRVDHQVKVRGFRIEPGEIEACLAGHEKVRDAVVMAAGGDRDKRLVAYVVSDDAPTTTELRAHVADTLPGHMVPAQFVVLDELPLTPNGKLDRAALPVPGGRPELDAAYAAPRTPTEEILAGIWSDVLGVERVGLHDDFFELGGHSLVATQVAARVRAGLGVELPVRALFELPTVAALAMAVAQGDRRSELPPGIAAVPRDGRLELSFAQQRLWLLDQIEPGGFQYNVSQALRLSGPLQRDALERALGGLVARHESLRTTFAGAGGRPVQVIHPPEPAVLEVTELDRFDPAEREARARRAVADAAQRPFDLARGPLVRATLIALDEDDHVLVAVMHHIVSDGWSMGVFTRELSALYDAFSRGEESPLEELPLQYADFAAWQRGWLEGDVLEGQLAYWRDRLAGLAPVLELPTDRPRPAERRGRGAKHSFALDATTLESLHAISRAHNATLFMTLTAAFQLLLSRYSGQSDVAVGTPIAGRTHAELEDLIGFFANTLVLRTDLSGDPRFTELLARVRETALGAYAHQDVPFEKLVEELQPPRSLSHTPLFQVMISLDGVSGELALGDVSVSELPIEVASSKFDLQLALRSSVDALEGVLVYDADLFEPDTVARMGDHLANLLDAIAADPDAPLSSLDMLAEPERRHLTVELNDTAEEFPSDSCLHELFEAQATKTPDAVALVFEDRQLTYKELDERANRLAHHLVSLGAGPGTLGICLERSLDLVTGLLAILKAGGAYVPLDPDYPQERVSFMLEDAGCKVVVTSSELAGLIGDEATTVLVDQHRVAIAAHPATKPETNTTAQDVAYVIYTSGSTGIPKGVAVGHRGVANRLAWMQARYPIGIQDAVLQKTPFSFDVSVWEFFWTLQTGARLVIARPGGHKDPTYLQELIEREGVSVIHFVPSMLAAYLAGAPQGPHPRLTFCSGEALSPELARAFKERFEGELHNLYGPTEASVDVTFYACSGEEETTVPIGRPIHNTQIYLLDAYSNPVPVGVPGELYIGGVNLAHGYLNRASLTAERFVPDPFATKEGQRLYRTGDLARYLSDGNIEFLGRADHQVKIRGFRIEPGEIEAALMSHEAITDAVVIARGDGNNDQRLVAYLVSTDPPTTTELRAHLLETLPEHMVPSAFVTLDAFPLTPNGKLDRKALPAPEGRPELEAAYTAPRTATEEILAGIWAEVLGVERVGIEDNFFELGGHSLVGVQVLARVHDRFGVEVPLRALFEAPTVAALAALLERLLVEEIQRMSLDEIEEAVQRDMRAEEGAVEDAR
jgi:amino acid adenylation domain-containing protein